MSYSLKMFYRWWLSNGIIAPDDMQTKTHVRHSTGLCVNLTQFLYNWKYQEGMTPEEESVVWEDHMRVSDEMAKQFTDAGLDRSHPFHANLLDYFAECHVSQCSENKLRIQWVIDKINEEAIEHEHSYE